MCATRGIDPVNVTGIASSSAQAVVIGTAVVTGGFVPKALLRGLGMKIPQFAGSSGFTSILSILSAGRGTAATGENVLRLGGRAASRFAVPIAIASVTIDAAAIATCTALD